MDINELYGMMQPSAQDKNEALTLGLLGLGSGLLQGSTGHYGQFAPALGAGIQHGMQGYMTGINQARDRRMQDIGLRLKLQELERKQKEEERMKAMVGELTPEQQQVYALGGGDALVNRMYPMPAKENIPWYVRRKAGGEFEIDPAYAEFEKTKSSFMRPQAQPMQPVPYVNEKGETIWGTITEAKGRPAANYNPALQGAIAASKERGKTIAEETVKAEFDAPRIIQNADTAITLSDELLKHPGFGQAVGKSAMFGLQKIPGTPGYDFMNRLSQIKGGAFLEAFNTLKGGGQITEVEGKKATDAIARMDNLTSEGEFKQAVKDFQDVIKKGVERARAKAGMQTQSAPVVRKYNLKTGRIE